MEPKIHDLALHYMTIKELWYYEISTEIETTSIGLMALSRSYFGSRMVDP